MKTMESQAVPEQLTSARLLPWVEHLSAVIGPRHPTSKAEREAARYIHDTIAQVGGRWEIINQPFRSIDGFRYRLAPLAAITGINLLFGLQRSRQCQWFSGGLSVGLSILSRDAFLARPALWETWLPRGESQNVIVRISPRGTVTRRVVFLAHMDSGVHRLTTSKQAVRHLPRTLGGVTLLALVGGVLTALSGRSQRWRGLRALIGGTALAAAGLAVADEFGPDVSGANGNASGVAALLGLAANLQQQPLDSTEVVLAFTGSATAVSTGAEKLATHYGTPWSDALWVVVNNVGVGELAWVTRHGISPYAYYHPHPAAVRLMEQVANHHPELGLMGKNMLTLDEVSILRDRNLRAVALTGYDRATGLIPHWRQSSDTMHVIEPDTLARAAQAVWAVAQQVDHASAWPLA